MSIKDQARDAAPWQGIQAHLGYTDEEMAAFREVPRNEEILSKAAALRSKTLVLEVVESHGCNSQHHVGDKKIGPRTSPPEPESHRFVVTTPVML
ncbi:MAG: hypothetical protein P8189_31175 [Anaerolineae bacterium]